MIFVFYLMFLFKDGHGVLWWDNYRIFRAAEIFYKKFFIFA